MTQFNRVFKGSAAMLASKGQVEDNVVRWRLALLIGLYFEQKRAALWVSRGFPKAAYCKRLPPGGLLAIHSKYLCKKAQRLAGTSSRMTFRRACIAIFFEAPGKERRCRSDAKRGGLLESNRDQSIFLYTLYIIL